MMRSSAGPTGRGVLRGRGRRRRRDEHGATLVEAAVILPVLFTLVFGVMEVGGALKANSSAANAVRSGARMASVAGNEGLADQQVLARMAQESAGFGKGEIEYIVIWHASSPSDTVPNACKPSNPTTPNLASVGVSDGGKTVNAVGACNVYIQPDMAGGAFDMATGQAAQPIAYYFGCTGDSDPTASHKVDCKWAPTNRRVVAAPRPTINPPDYLGGYLQAKHDYYTGILGQTLTVTDSGVTLLEPQGYSS
jgi:Flp pilus assembly pilin Flp